MRKLKGTRFLTGMTALIVAALGVALAISQPARSKDDKQKDDQGQMVPGSGL